MRPQYQCDANSFDLTLGGAPVLIGKRAEIDRRLLENHTDLVQEALNAFGVPDWGCVEDSFTFVLKRTDPAVEQSVVKPYGENLVMYAFHTEHTSVMKQPVPFLVQGAGATTRCITLQIAGSANQPAIVRLYTGEYRPGLPWQGSVWNDEELLEESIAFWKDHAYVYDPFIVSGKLSSFLPLWQTDFDAFRRRREQRARASLNAGDAR